MKDKKKNVIEWIGAAIISLLIANFLCFFYYNPSHGSEHNNYRLEPNIMGLDATEGFGILYSDKNGFPNKNIPLVDTGYILCMGSSFTKEDQVMIDDRWPEIVNSTFEDSDFLHVYNMGYNGGKLENIVKNFRQLVDEFPNSRAVIIEIDDSTIMWSEEQYNNAMNQIEPEDAITGIELGDHNAIGRVKLFVKTYCPLLLLYYEQMIQFIDGMEFDPFFQGGELRIRDLLTVFDGNKEEIVVREEQQDNVAEIAVVEEQEAENEGIITIKEQYRNALSLLKEQYEGDLIIIYHPRIRINEEDELEIIKTEAAVYFEEVCKGKEISFLDMTDMFVESFEQNYILPYGFWNTTMGEGHFNKYGNELMARKILSYLEMEAE